jgi:hypothetical protein
MKFMSVNRQQVSAGQIEQLDLFAEHLPALGAPSKLGRTNKLKGVCLMK